MKAGQKGIGRQAIQEASQRLLGEIRVMTHFKRLDFETIGRR
jgi:hypothetical protein